MSDEYQLRKDIDRFKSFLDALEYSLQERGINDLNIEELLRNYYDKSDIDIIEEDVANVDYSHSIFLNNVVRLFPLIAEVTELPIKEGIEVPDDYPYFYVYVNQPHYYNNQYIPVPRGYKVINMEWQVMNQESDAFIDSELYVWISQYFPQRDEVDEKVFDWEAIDLNNQYASLRVNENLRLADFRYYRTGYNISSTDPILLERELIPVEYLPLDNVVCSNYNPNQSSLISVFDPDTQKMGNFYLWSTATGSRNINVNAMWHYGGSEI